MRTKSEIAEIFTPVDQLASDWPFYLVGIGGAGMSALARMLKNRGLIVRGSDSTPSSITAELEATGIPIRIGHSGDDIRRGDQVILSDAIDLADSPEVAAAKKLKCKLFRRSQLLGWLLRGKRIIAVTGTHGKTTVTGMIGAGLRAAGLDPTIVVGAEVPEFGGAVVEGAGLYAVVEACEAYESYLDIEPYIVVLTNLEPDHLDFHGTFEELKASVWRFASRLPDDGKFVFNANDPGALELAQRFDRERTVAFGSVRWETPIALPGEHNILNAGAAKTVADLVLSDPSEAYAAIAAFKGAERRLQVLREGPITVVDDYAHHPTEIEASLKALKQKYADRRIIVVYQPHLYSRTAQFIEEFARALSHADYVVLTDIYPARENPMPGVSSARIEELITVPVDYVPSRHLLPRHVAIIAKPGDLVVGMGAGNIAEFVPAFLNEIDRSGPTKVAVVYGGDSTEREVSLHGGRAIKEALKNRGYDAWLVDVTDILLDKGELSALAGSNRPDLAFLTVHGTNAEDGAIQGFFELLHIPYTGSGIQASALAMDKDRTRQIASANGLLVPEGMLVWSSDESIPFEPPYVVKPNAQGSTVGVSFVSDRESLTHAIEKALRYQSGALVEERIQGTEVSVPVLIDEALPVVEILPREGVYDFAAKYLPGATEEIVPARLPEPIYKECQRIAQQVHQLMRCSGATRTDMMVRGDEIFVLEINTIPGMTGTSLLPNSARAAGISFEELCDRMAQDALRRHAAKS